MFDSIAEGKIENPCAKYIDPYTKQRIERAAIPRFASLRRSGLMPHAAAHIAIEDAEVLIEEMDKL